jgi:TPR repeat protein
MNQVEAVKWWSKAGENGDAEAQFYMGLNTDNSAAAFQWYLKSPKQGLAGGTACSSG